MRESPQLKVFVSRRGSVCKKCKKRLGRRAWVLSMGSQTARCLACARLDHLTFLPSGDAALTRRAKRRSDQFAVVLKFNQATRRYERQGLLVTQEAISAAKQECSDDEDARHRRRQREAKRREKADRAFVAKFAQRIRELFPNCPAGREQRIALHACQKFSRRVGRSAAAKKLDAVVVRMAVTAHIRHEETEYERLLEGGLKQTEARVKVRVEVNRVMQAWGK